MTSSDITRQHGVSQATFYGWRSKYGGMDLPMIKKNERIRRRKQTTKENVCGSEYGARDIAGGN